MACYFSSLLVLLTIISGCDKAGQNALSDRQQKQSPPAKLTCLISDTSTLEKHLINKNLVNINSVDTGVRVTLMYSTASNFLHKPVYEGLTRGYLPCEVAIKLCNAQFFLKQIAPHYNLIVFDATRPAYIQKKMWTELDLPENEKKNYLAHPNDVSLHNYGAAVDVGLISNDNLLLDMGTTFDSFNELSQPKKEALFLKEGKLSRQAYANRLLLRRVMLQAGFLVMNTEWWHFNSTNKITAAKKYDLIE